MAQTLEKIVRCPVLLDDHDNMLETRDLRVSEQRPKEKQQRTSKGEFHPVSGRRFANDLITLTFVFWISKRLPDVRNRHTLAVRFPWKRFEPEHDGVCFFGLARLV